MSTSSTSDREIVISRVINAPRTKVWEAWTKPEHLIHWWGPNGFTNTFKEISVKPGGVWRFIMHGPDGTDYPNKIIYEEIIKPEKITYRHNADIENDPDEFFTEVTFETVENPPSSASADFGGARTKVTLRLICASPEVREKFIKEVGAIEGGNQTLGKMAEYVEEKEEIIFDADHDGAGVSPDQMLKRLKKIRGT